VERRGRRELGALARRRLQPRSGDGKLERWTASEAGGLPVERFVVPQLVRLPTFDEERPGVKRTIPD